MFSHTFKEICWTHLFCLWIFGFFMTAVTVHYMFCSHMVVLCPMGFGGRSDKLLPILCSSELIFYHRSFWYIFTMMYMQYAFTYIFCVYKFCLTNIRQGAHAYILHKCNKDAEAQKKELIKANMNNTITSECVLCCDVHKMWEYVRKTAAVSSSI